MQQVILHVKRFTCPQLYVACIKTDLAEMIFKQRSYKAYGKLKWGESGRGTLIVVPLFFVSNVDLSLL